MNWLLLFAIGVGVVLLAAGSLILAIVLQVASDGRRNRLPRELPPTWGNPE